MCQTLASEAERSPDPALGGFPATEEGDTGQRSLTQAAAGAGEQLCLGSQNTWLPVPIPPSTFAGGISVGPQTSGAENESCVF